MNKEFVMQTYRNATHILLAIGMFVVLCFASITAIADDPEAFGETYTSIIASDTDYYFEDDFYYFVSFHWMVVYNSGPEDGGDIDVEFIYGNGFQFNETPPGDIDSTNPAFADGPPDPADPDDAVNHPKTRNKHIEKFKDISPAESVFASRYIGNYHQFPDGDRRQIGAYTYIMATDTHGNQIWDNWIKTTDEDWLVDNDH